MLVIVRPSPHERVPLHDQLTCRRLFVGLDERPYLLEACRNVLACWFDDELAVALAYLLSQEIEAILAVCHDRFCWGEGEPPRSHEWF